MREYDASPSSADERIEATQANEQQAEILGIDPGSPLLLITRTSYTEKGVAVESLATITARTARGSGSSRGWRVRPVTRADSSPAS